MWCGPVASESLRLYEVSSGQTEDRTHHLLSAPPDLLVGRAVTSQAVVTVLQASSDELRKVMLLGCGTGCETQSCWAAHNVYVCLGFSSSFFSLDTLDTSEYLPKDHY